MILPEPQRALPLTLHPEIFRRLNAGRVRRLHVADHRFSRLQPGDMIWLREALIIPARQPSRDWLSLVYAGDGAQTDIRWPRVLARPSTGGLPAQAMPLQASRLTLVVQSVAVLRLQQINEDEAIAAGVDFAPGGGFCNPLAPRHQEQAFPEAREAFGRLWDCALGAEALGAQAWTANPEVVALEVRAMARNIARLFPGVGKGGVR